MTESGGGSAKLQESFPYEDIVNLPHHRSETHPHMSMEERAAQFSSFAALTGHKEAVHKLACYLLIIFTLSRSTKLL